MVKSARAKTPQRLCVDGVGTNDGASRTAGLAEGDCGERGDAFGCEAEHLAEEAFGENDGDADDAVGVVVEVCGLGLPQRKPPCREHGLCLQFALTPGTLRGRRAVGLGLAQDGLGLLVGFSNDALGRQTGLQFLARHATCRRWRWRREDWRHGQASTDDARGRGRPGHPVATPFSGAGRLALGTTAWPR